MTRWTTCPLCGCVAESLAVSLGCTGSGRGEEPACRNYSPEAYRAWKLEGYPHPGDARAEFWAEVTRADLEEE